MASGRLSLRVPYRLAFATIRSSCGGDRSRATCASQLARARKGPRRHWPPQSRSRIDTAAVIIGPDIYPAHMGFSGSRVRPACVGARRADESSWAYGEEAQRCPGVRGACDEPKIHCPLGILPPRDS
jgi:hypothetical protein